MASQERRDVDEKGRQIYFSANGMYPGKDPYFVYYYRINFDGTNLVTLTPGEGSHAATFSPDRSLLIDTYSRVDAAPVTELRSGKDGSLIATLEKADITSLQMAGWKPPEVFVAKGRDGSTDIWGVIYRPTNFDAARKYPVIENIYAGPQGSFVPKTFATYNQMQAQADIGFIVVQIDGMGTNYRSKAFHDVAWKNLGDAGFPDRILWHKAVAAKYPSYDIARVGLYGNSAGGQNSLGGLLFHPEFYKAAVSSAAVTTIAWTRSGGTSSGWDGLSVPSTLRRRTLTTHTVCRQGPARRRRARSERGPVVNDAVVNQLIKHNKDFELLVIPGAGHGPAAPTVSTSGSTSSRDTCSV